MSGNYAKSIYISKQVVLSSWITYMLLELFEDTPPSMCTSANFRIGEVLLVYLYGLSYMIRHLNKIDRW